MDVEQYQRDIARIEAHKLALKDDAFNNNLVELIRKAVGERFDFLNQRLASKLKLHDQAFESISVESADGLRVVTFVFDYLHHEARVEARGLRFAVLIDNGNKPVIMAHSAGQALGEVDTRQITKLTRKAVDAVAPELPRPID